MKFIFAFTLFAATMHAEYSEVNLVVFGMDCAPCAHAIRVSMKGIPGVSDVAVNLNTGLVSIRLAPGNAAAMRQFNQAVEKNGFTHKEAHVAVRGHMSGDASAPILEVSGSGDHYALVPATQEMDISKLLGKLVTVEGVIPQSAKGKLSGVLRFSSLTEEK